MTGQVARFNTATTRLFDAVADRNSRPYSPVTLYIAGDAQRWARVLELKFRAQPPWVAASNVCRYNIRPRRRHQQAAYAGKRANSVAVLMLPYCCHDGRSYSKVNVGDCSG